MKPWEAQEAFNKRAEDIKEPYDIKVRTVSRGFCIEWKRRPGIIDGFIILAGNNPDALLEIARVPKGGKQVYSETFNDFRRGSYYVTVVAYKGNKSSVRPTPLQISIGEDHQNGIPEISNIEEISGTTPITERPEETQAENHKTVSAKNSEEKIEAICGLCNGNIVFNEELKVYQCLTCEAQLIKNIKEQLVYVNQLKNGICKCCDPRRPLIKQRGKENLICSHSGEEYAKIGQNEVVKLSELDYGLCSCCRPPNPLILNQQSQVVCSKERDHLHVKERGRWIYHPPEPEMSSVDEIDQALANGSAIMGPNGIINSNPRNRNS